MYHVRAQGVDERMINVHYYYYYYLPSRSTRGQSTYLLVKTRWLRQSLHDSCFIFRDNILRLNV